MSDQYSSICILRLSAIGDVCHAVSVVQAIQRTYPKAKITWVIGKVEAMLLEGMPGIKFVIFDKRQGRAAYQHLKQQFSGQCFDVLLHMQLAFRANWAARFIPAKVKIGFDRSRAKELHSLFINRRITAQNQPHVLEGFQNFARAIGVECDRPSWLMPFEESHETKANELLQDHNRILVISPAASKAERNWLPDRYAAIADYADEKGFNIVLTGGPTESEKQLCESIVSHAKCTITNIAGQTDLKTLLCVLKRASLVIAPDTGPAHMAVTVATPVIGLYAHSNPKRTGPYGYLDYVVEVYNQTIIQQKGKPAEQLPWGTRAKGEQLMAQITVEQVKDMFDRVIAIEQL